MAAGIAPKDVTSDFSPASVEHLADVKPLLKFDATIITEENVVDHTLPYLVLKAAKGKRGVESFGLPKPRPEPRDYWKRRRDIIERHFPLTIERLRSDAATKDLRCECENAGIRSWQMEQAICNLTISTEMCSGLPHYRCIATRKDLTERVISAMHNRYEGIATPKATFRPGEVIEQARLDGLALLRELGKKVKAPSIRKIQQLLAEGGFLDSTK